MKPNPKLAFSFSFGSSKAIGLKLARLVIGALFLMEATARAGNTYSYIGKDIDDPENFFIPANWTGGPTGTFPGADDTATIGYQLPGSSVYQTFAVHAAGTISVKNLTIENVSSLYFRDLNVSGTFNVGDTPNSVVEIQCTGAPGTLKNTGTMNVSLKSTLSGSCIFENFGTLNLGNLGLEPGPGGIVFNNMTTGIVEMGDSFFGSISGGFTFNNYGYLRKPSSPGMASIDKVVFMTSGVVEVGNGSLKIGGTDSGLTSNNGRFTTLTAEAVIEYASPWTVNDGTHFTGPGTHLCSGSMDLHGNVSVGFRDLVSQMVTVGHFALTGAISGPGNILVAADALNPSTFDWMTGTLGGAGRLNVDSGGSLNIAGTTTHYLGGRTINNSGTTKWSGANNVAASDAAFTFNNLAGALFEIDNDESFSGFPGSRLHNWPGANFRKMVGTHVTTFNPPFDNDGIEEVQTGILDLTGGGESSGVFNAAAGAGTSFAGGSVFNLNQGSSFTGEGVVLGSGAEVTLKADVAAVNYSLLLGTLDGPGNLNISHDFDMGIDSGGCTLAGAGAVNISPSATLNITGSQRKNIVQRHLNNAGLAVWVGAGDITMSDGAIFNNLISGKFFANNNSIIRSGGGAPQSFNNSGIFTKNLTTGETTVDGPAFLNSGTINLLSGTLTIAFPSFTQTTGSINLDGGILKSINNPLEIQGGSIFGSGAILGSIDNTGGVISPGHSPGIINETGSFSQLTRAVLEIQIDGPNAATDYDQLIVSGSAALGGILRVKVEKGFAPELSAQFKILKAASLVGTFTTLELPPGLSVNYTSTGVVIVVSGLVPSEMVAPSYASGALTFSFNSIKGRAYVIESTPDLLPQHWSVFQNVTGDGTLMQLSAATADSPQRFFRMFNP